jgi:IclR helix-turn-helix domain
LSVLSVIICPMSNGGPISITLSPAQVDQVVRAAAQGSAPSFSALISTTLNAQRPANDGAIEESPAASADAAATASADAVVPAADNAQQNGEPALDMTSYFPTYRDARLSRSLLRGLFILTCFGPDNGERGIIELAGRLGMSASTTHRYVATLVELGLLERCARTRKYRLARIPDGAQRSEDPLLGEHRGTSVAQPALDD